MKEDFLHYLWRFKKFETLDLRTTQNEPLIIIKTGDYLELSGPDFGMGTAPSVPGPMSSIWGLEK